MKLNLLERVVTLDLLPKAGNYMTLKIVHEAKMALSVAEKEHKEFGIELISNGDDKTKGGYKWNDKGIEEREIDLGEEACKIIAEALEKINSAGKDGAGELTDQNFSLYYKFCILPKEAIEKK